MAIFEIYASQDRETVEFVSDKKSIFALIIPAVWLLWNRLWFAFGVYALIAILFAGLSTTDWSFVIAFVSFIPGVFVFLEGKNWIAEKHEREGLQFMGVMEADSSETAEMRWFSDRENWQIEKAEYVLQNSPHNQFRSRENEVPEFGIFASDQ